MVGSQASISTLDARRGALVDRRRRDLAVTRVAYRLFVDPVLVTDNNTFSEQVGYGLGYDPAWVEQTIAKRRDSRYITLDERLSDERLAKFHALQLKGLAIEPTLVRDYPQHALAGQLVGFVGDEGTGLDGLELAFNDRLKPDPGQYAYVRDGGRRALWLASQEYRPHTDGRPIRLSLDLHLQAIAEEELAAVVDQYRAAAGQVIVMDPYTGEILALANYPIFDPADFGETTQASRRNRAVTDVFEPGSVLKPFVWAAAVEAGVVDPDEMIDTTTAGWWKPARGPVLRDAHPHGLVSWDDVLMYSSNIGMAKIAERLGPAALHRIVESYGFGEPTGSGLPGEIGGLLRPLKRWSGTDLSRIPMGQGVAVTALQVTRAFCALANDGVLVAPTIEAIDPLDPDRRPAITSRVLSPSVARPHPRGPRPRRHRRHRPQGPLRPLHPLRQDRHRPTARSRPRRLFQRPLHQLHDRRGPARPAPPRRGRLHPRPRQSRRPLRRHRRRPHRQIHPRTLTPLPWRPAQRRARSRCRCRVKGRGHAKAAKGRQGKSVDEPNQSPHLF